MAKTVACQANSSLQHSEAILLTPQDSHCQSLTVTLKEVSHHCKWHVATGFPVPQPELHGWDPG